MLSINTRITIGTNELPLYLNTYNSIKIYSNIGNLTDTAEINIPAKNIKMTPKIIYYYNNDKEYEIGVGKPISIEVVFDDKFRGIQQFQGYVSGFNENDEFITIVCEDSMYLFKQSRFQLSIDKLSEKVINTEAKINSETNYSFDIETKGTDYFSTLYTIIQTIFNKSVGGFAKIVNDLNYRLYRWNCFISDFKSGRFFTNNNYTGAKTFEYLKEYYGIHIYFKNEVFKAGDKINKNKDDAKYTFPQLADEYITIPRLYVGLKYASDIESKHKKEYKFGFPYNVALDNKINTIIDLNDLEYNYFDKENDLVINYISEQENTNKPLKASTDDGVTVKTTDANIKLISDKIVSVTKKIPNLSQEDINEYAKDNWKNYPDRGFKGSFITFGSPYVRVGDIVDIYIDSSFDINNSNVTNERYFVDAVDITVDQINGFIQKITLGSKLNDN